MGLAGPGVRELPPAEQLSTLTDRLSNAVGYRDKMAARLAPEDAPDEDARRVALAQLVSELDRIAARIAELTGKVPDHP